MAINYSGNGSFPTNIELLETTDSVEGGMEGSSNRPIKQLADRTQFLLEKLTPPGVVEMYAGASAPSGWMICDGSAIDRILYSDLFEIIGTTFGAGNGSTTFNIPDLRGEFVRGLDRGRTVDPQRVLGSSQIGTIMPIDATGVNQPYVANYTYTPGLTPADANLVAQTTGLDIAGLATTNRAAVFVNATGTDGFIMGVARPRNVALNFIIKL